MAIISIKKLLLRTRVGFMPHEVDKLQDVLLNIDITYNLQGEEVSDNPDGALDYRAICKEVMAIVEGKKFNLIETIANEVVNHLLAIARVTEVTVRVDKPHALRFAGSVSITVNRVKE